MKEEKGNVNGNTNQENSGNENVIANNKIQNNSDGDTNQENSGNENVIDYEKLESILKNATQKKEDIVLRDYLKQQGLTKEEIKSAVDEYKNNIKRQKQQQEQSVTDLKTKFEQATKEVQDTKIELAATKTAIELGIDSKTLKYILKMAELKDVIDKDGKIKEEEIKTALNKVLEDIPALKNTTNTSKGFQIGVLEQTEKQHQEGYSTPKKRWNRFN